MPFIMLVQLLVVVIIILVLAALAPIGVFKVPESMSEIEKLFSSPLVLLALTVFVAAIAPAVEEIFKTLAVWPLLGLKIGDGGGYVAGLMSGAAFAMVEGMLYAAQTAMTPGNDWLYFLLGRFGGTLIHIFNGGLIGWGLAKSLRDHKFARLVLVYLLAFLVHGFWNLAVVVTQLIPSLKGQEVNLIASNGLMAILAFLVASIFFAFAHHVLKNTKNEQVIIEEQTHAS